MINDWIVVGVADSFSRISHEISICVKISWDPSEDESADRSLGQGRRYEEVRCVLPLRFTALPESFGGSNKDGLISGPYVACCCASNPANTRFYISGSSSSSSLVITPSNWSPAYTLSSVSPDDAVVVASPSAACTCRPNLPAYSQLFYENGERREEDDEAGWLPPYCRETEV